MSVVTYLASESKRVPVERGSRCSRRRHQRKATSTISGPCRERRRGTGWGRPYCRHCYHHHPGPGRRVGAARHCGRGRSRWPCGPPRRSAAGAPCSRHARAASAAARRCAGTARGLGCSMRFNEMRAAVGIGETLQRESRPDHGSERERCSLVVALRIAERPRTRTRRPCPTASTSNSVHVQRRPSASNGVLVPAPGSRPQQSLSCHIAA